MNNLKHTLNIFWNEAVKSLPNVLIGIGILLIGWLFALLIEKMIYKVLSSKKPSKIGEFLSINRWSEKLETSIDLATIVSKIAYWVVFIFFVVAASETFGWKNVSIEISRFIAYLPKILSALIIFAIGYTIANFVRKTLQSIFATTGMMMGTLLSEIIFYFLLVLITITALSQAGIDTSILSANALLIVGAFAATFTLAVGLGAKEVVSDLFKNFYNRKVLKLGDRVSLNDLTGIVVELTRTPVVLENETGKIVLPAHSFYSQSFKILKKN